MIAQDEPARADQVVQGLVILVRVDVAVEEQHGAHRGDRVRQRAETAVLHDELDSHDVCVVGVEPLNDVLQLVAQLLVAHDGI